MEGKTITATLNVNEKRKKIKHYNGKIVYTFTSSQHNTTQHNTTQQNNGKNSNNMATKGKIKQTNKKKKKKQVLQTFKL